jgi:RHS repeat-associated protein
VDSNANPGDDSRFDYTAYGLNDTEKDYSGMNFNAKCPYKFAGAWGYYDGSGRGSDQTADAMTLCGHRFYSPGIARWLTEDPIGFAGGLNLYGYCRGRATACVDPYGLDDDGPHISIGFTDTLEKFRQDLEDMADLFDPSPDDDYGRETPWPSFPPDPADLPWIGGGDIGLIGTIDWGRLHGYGYWLPYRADWDLISTTPVTWGTQVKYEIKLIYTVASW